MAIDTISGGDPTTVVTTVLTTLLTPATSDPTNPDTPAVEPSTIVSVLSNTELVHLDTITEVVTVTGVDSVVGSDKDGSALIVTDNTRAVTVAGGSGENKLLVGNNVAGTQINTGTGSGTVVGGDGGSVIGTSADAKETDHFNIIGGKGNDTVVVTNGQNTIAAAEGNNLIGLIGGNNFVYASGTVFGGRGNDTIGAGKGDSTLVGGSGNSMLIGGSGNSMLVGGSGNSTMFAGTGSSTLFGGSGSSNMIGGASGDMIVGGAGSSTLAGGAGNDTLIGGTGQSTLYGGADNNMFVFSTVFGGGKAVIGDFGASAGNRLAIQGYGTTTADLLRNAVVSGGNTTLSLSDGTQITLVGFPVLNSTHLLVCGGGV